jgi:orotidine-5'-phosphate decarboxylase
MTDAERASAGALVRELFGEPDDQTPQRGEVSGMTQLIVALDIDEPERFEAVFQACRSAGVTFFKLNARALMLPWWGSRQNPVGYIQSRGCDVMLDLKVYDTADTVRAVAKRAFAQGARFLTVHATPSMLEAAMQADKPLAGYHKVIAVGALTDGSSVSTGAEGHADGFVCPAHFTRATADALHEIGKIIVCPGIRPVDHTGDYTQRNNHAAVSSPFEAKAAGADYIVVGRPIIDAEDPAAAARAIMEEIA